MNMVSETLLMAAGGFRQAGLTIIMNPHYMDEAQGCDKMGLVWQDKLMADGTSSQATRQTETKNLEDAFLALSRGQEAS